MENKLRTDLMDNFRDNFYSHTYAKSTKYITKYNFWGLKLHPRLNNFNLLNEKVIKLVNVAGRLNKPVIVDCFPDGNSLINNFDYPFSTI